MKRDLRLVSLHPKFEVCVVRFCCLGMSIKSALQKTKPNQSAGAVVRGLLERKKKGK